MERTERMTGILCDEWENVIVLCSRVGDTGETQAFRFMSGNHLANQQLLEDTVEDVAFGAIGGDDGEKEKEGC